MITFTSVNCWMQDFYLCGIVLLLLLLQSNILVLFCQSLCESRVLMNLLHKCTEKKQERLQRSVRVWNLFSLPVWTHLKTHRHLVLSSQLSPVSAGAVGTSRNLQPDLPPVLLSVSRHSLQQQLRDRQAERQTGRHSLLKQYKYRVA